MIEVKLSGIVKCLAVSALAVGLASCAGNGSDGTTTGSTGTTNGSSLSGSYIFSVTGTDPNDGDYFALGRIVADGKGNITSGVADYNLGSGIDENVPLTGTYTVTSGIATIKLTDGGSLSDTLTVALTATSTEPIQSFDGTGSGTLYAQSSTGYTTTGSYSYTIKGSGVGGTVTGSGGFIAQPGGTFTGGILSYMDGSGLMTYPSVSGFLYPLQLNGRGQAALIGDNFAYYVVSPSQILMIGLDEHALLLITATKP